MTFKELGVADEILSAIQEMGFVNPMPVQEAVIPYLLGDMNDIIALAQTGTGKTAAFGIPIIQSIQAKNKAPQALVLCPTRELCLQIAGDIQDYAKYTKDLKVLPVYGGSSIESQIRSLKRGVHIIIATPGRLLDLIRRRTVHLDQISNVVMDEADEMLNMGFSEDIDSILSEVPTTRNMLLFSATMPAEISRITKKYMKNPKEVVIGNKNQANKNVTHVFYKVQARDKYSALKRIVDFYPKIYGIIFCRTRKDTKDIAEKLMEDGYSADALHGELSQAQRDGVMQRFRSRNIQLLVATDVAARGLDVNDLTHVIHFGLPDEAESYTHRSGRTARAGKTGTSISIIHIKEKGKLKLIERKIGKQIEEQVIPTSQAICEKQLMNLVDRLEKVKVDEEQIDRFISSASSKLDWLQKEDLIKRVIALEFNRLMEYYHNAPEIRSPREERGERNERGERGERGERRNPRKAQDGYTRLFINVGKKDDIFPNTLIDLINQNVNGSPEIGKIDIMLSFSFFEVLNKDLKDLVLGMKDVQFAGRKVSIEIAESSEQNDGRRDHNNRRPKQRDRGNRSRPTSTQRRANKRDDSKETNFSDIRRRNRDKRSSR